MKAQPQPSGLVFWGETLRPGECTAHHAVRVSITCDQVGKISIPAAFNSLADGIGDLKTGQAVLCTPRGGPHSIRGSAHIRGCGILQSQWVDPKGKKASFGIGAWQMAIFSWRLLHALGSWPRGEIHLSHLSLDMDKKA